MKLRDLVDEIKKKKKKKYRLPIVRRSLYGWGFMPVNHSHSTQSDSIGGGDSVALGGGDGGDGGAGGGDGGGGGGMEENISSPYIYKIETDDENFTGDRFDKLADFSKFVVDDLGLKSKFDVMLTKDKPGNNIKTLAHFDNAGNKCCIYTQGRNLADILRSLAHELVHKGQFEQDKIKLPIQDIGGPIEDEANAVAGQLVKKFGYKNPEIFE